MSDNTISIPTWALPLVVSLFVGAISYGTQGIGSPDPDNYIAYDQVTEVECINWCKAEMGEEQVTSIEDGLTANINLQKNPVDGHGTPWSEQ